MGVTEGAVRYYLRRAAAGARDRRGEKIFKVERLGEVIAAWFAAASEQARPVNVQELYEHLVTEYGYGGRIRRCALRAGALSAAEDPDLSPRRDPARCAKPDRLGRVPGVDIAGERSALHAFVMVLSHSRKPAVVWSRSEDELSWLRCHKESFRRLAGVAAVNRIDSVGGRYGGQTTRSPASRATLPGGDSRAPAPNRCDFGRRPHVTQ